MKPQWKKWNEYFDLKAKHKFITWICRECNECCVINLIPETTINHCLNKPKEKK